MVLEKGSFFKLSKLILTSSENTRNGFLKFKAQRLKMKKA
jgi:hypothetical protein